MHKMNKDIYNKVSVVLHIVWRWESSRSDGNRTLRYSTNKHWSNMWEGVRLRIHMSTKSHKRETTKSTFGIIYNLIFHVPLHLGMCVCNLCLSLRRI